jgi:serine/threonine-protein kinase RsbW
MGTRASAQIHGEGRQSSKRVATSSATRSSASSPTVEPFVRLTVPARPEQVALIRRVLEALADSLPLPPRVIEDMRLAVTEACTNVVRHAYGDAEGPLELVIRPRGAHVEVVVTDRGHGMMPSRESSGAGLGLSLISALTERFEIEHAPGAGCRLLMAFSTRSADRTSVEAG